MSEPANAPGPPVVFCGPSLPIEDCRRLFPELELLPPARRGDVLDACERSPAAIGLIDGYFDHQLSVWHKEILWALHRGIPVYGAASMGALRAAELEAFGMVGVGWIFQRFSDGTLEDDDEVALVHDSASRGYRPLSVPLVNLRATLESALAKGVIGAPTQAALLAAGKARFYPERRLGEIVEDAARGGAPAAELRAFSAWLPDGYVDQKGRDAVELLRRMRADAAARPAVQDRPRFRFEYTESWHELRMSKRRARG